jgi:hypothetical protein
MNLRQRCLWDWPSGLTLSQESIMGNQKQNPALTDEEQKRENERADYQKGRASNRERKEEQNRSRTQQNGPKREIARYR